MTQPNQTTPTVLSTGPWMITICECGATELDHRGMPPECEATHHQWRIEVIPLSTLSRLVERLERKATDTADIDYAYCVGLRDAASLISQSLPTTQEDE